MAMNYLGDKKITVGLMVAILASLIGLQQWANIVFIPRAQAEQSIKDLSDKIDSTNKLMVDHISVYDKREIKKAIGVVKDQQYSLREYVSANGSTPMTNQRAEDLKRKLSDFEDTKACYQRNGNNCE